MAIAAWEHAVSSGVVGPRPVNSRHTVSTPTTPSRYRAHSIPLHADSLSPSNAHNITPSPVTHLCNAVSSPGSSPSSGRSEGPSSLGSATRLASIISALEELDAESREPSYVVLRGLSPGVYASRCVSALFFSVSSLMIKL